MKNKQDNLQQFRGSLKREIDRTKEEARNEKEKHELLRNFEKIKIECYRGNNEMNRLMFIRLFFDKALIPNEFIPEIRIVLGELFNEYL